ncbi:MAG: hypothetical protein JWN80_2951 [Microbacteriaceae bacterium]|nr:hypothetical protein [Microbacteriaceae bacterium]
MHKHRLRSIPIIAAAVIGTTALLAGCSSASTPTASSSTKATTLAQLYKQAVAAGQTTINIYGPAEATFAGVYDQFQKEFPKIKVTGEFLFGGPLQTRIQQEQTTQQYKGDLLHLDDSVNYVDNEQVLNPIGVGKLPTGVSLEGGKLIVPTRSLYVSIYNTDKLKAADVPQTWSDIVNDTVLNGVTGISDPTGLTSTSTGLYSALKDKAIDNAWLTKFAASKPKIYQSTSQLVNAVATGELSYTPIAYYGFELTAKQKGADVGFVVPKDGAVVADDPYAMLKGAPDPLAARLLISWLLTKEGQTDMALLANEYGTMPGTPSPSNVPLLSDIKPFTQVAANKREQFKTDAITEMKKYFTN